MTLELVRKISTCHSQFLSPANFCHHPFPATDPPFVTIVSLNFL